MCEHGSLEVLEMLRGKNLFHKNLLFIGNRILNQWSHEFAYYYRIP
jgi:hypothetical protein